MQYTVAMTDFYIVSGNKGKVAEFKRLLPSDMSFETTDIDLPEIQSIDSTEIITDKAKRAFAIVGKPVLVEDVTAGLASMGGLPGPFIKFFEKQMGYDALHKLAAPGDQATVTCTIGFFDGTTMVIAKGSVEGSTVPARGGYGFGFDCCFVPNGQTGQAKTYAEMPPVEKDAISHRGHAVKDLVAQMSSTP